MSSPTFSREASEIRISVQRLARRLRNERADDTMSDSQLGVLAWLSHTGTFTLGELAAKERVSAPSMNRTVNCLEEAGFVRRTADDEDRRKVNITLTDAGHEIVAETARRRDEWFDAALDELTAEERATLREAAAIMRKVSDR